MENISNSFWEVTYRQNIARMIGVCWRYTQNREIAEDLAHDAFLVAINKASSFENKGPFEAWLRRIVINVALQYLREQKKQRKFNDCPALYDDVVEIPEEHPETENFAFTETELLEIIGSLPEHHRLVFNLYVVDNFTHSQIAAKLGISEGTSKSHLARARKKIRELLDKQLRKNKDRRKALFWYLLPSKFWNHNGPVAGKLKNLSIPPLKRLPLEHTGFSNMPIVQYKPARVSTSIYLKTGLMAIASVLILGGAPNLTDSKEGGNAGSENIILSNAKPTISVTPEKASKVNSNSKNSNLPKFPETKTATIGNNPIIVEKTKTLEQMKNLRTIGGLLLASLAFDSDTLAKALPVPFKNEDITETRNTEQKLPESAKPNTKRNDKPLEGTFYASKIFWSEKHNELYLLGDHVKVNLNTQKFTGSGTFTFINKFGYLIIDGTPVKLNQTVKLADKKYRLIELRQDEAVKKYGDNGKDGAVEIALDE